MMPVIYDWPANLVPRADTVPVLEKNIASAGPSLTGQERFIATDAGRWRYGFTVQLAPRKKVLAWQAIIALTEGRGNSFRVPIYQRGLDPASVAGYTDAILPAIPPEGLSHDDGALFSDGAGYQQSFSTATVAADAALGATSVTITMDAALAPEPGQYFSDGDRLYQIRTVTDLGGGSYALTFLPRLRAALWAGDAISFDGLFCLMRIADDDMLRVDLDLMRFGEASVEFVEALV